MTTRHTNAEPCNAGQTRRLRVAGIVAFVMAQAGCVSALPSAQRSSGSETLDARTAFASVEEVDVIVQYGNWPVPARVDRYLTPVRVVVQNRGDRSLHILHQDLSLVGLGQHAAAIPPDYFGAAELTAGAFHAPPNRDPLFVKRDFQVAPPAAGASPIFPTQADTYDYARNYHPQHPSRFVGVRHATEWMTEQAMPTGTVEPGRFVDGLVFFEPLLGPPQEYELSLVLSTADGTWVGAVRVPLKGTTDSYSVPRLEFREAEGRLR